MPPSTLTSTSNEAERAVEVLAGANDGFARDTSDIDEPTSADVAASNFVVAKHRNLVRQRAGQTTSRSHPIAARRWPTAATAPKPLSPFRQNATATHAVALPSEARWQSIGGGDEEPSVRTDAIDALRASRGKAVNFSACEVPCSLSL